MIIQGLLTCIYRRLPECESRASHLEGDFTWELGIITPSPPMPVFHINVISSSVCKVEKCWCVK